MITNTNHDASLPYPSLLIRASAGTGKTFRLTNRILQLLFDGELPEKILASTFTKKAAAEIEERLLTRLAKASVTNSESLKLTSELGIKQFSPAEAREVLLSIIKKQHILGISTLDSFFSKILRAFSSDFGISPNWKIAQEASILSTKESALEKCLSHNLEELTEITYQILSQEPYKQVNSGLIDALTNLRSLFNEASPEAWGNLPLPPLPRASISELIEIARELELPKTKKGAPNKHFQNAMDNFILHAQNQNWEELTSKGIGDAIISGKDTFQSLLITEGLLKLYDQFFEIIRHDLVTQLNIKAVALRNLLGILSNEYLKQSLLKKQLAFADVPFIISKIIETQSLDEIYFRLDTRYAHLLLDEFQDTALSQWDIIKPIVEEIISKGGNENSFFCVGDTKQAIYAWRGGVSELFSSIEEIPGINCESLELSYRSAPQVIELVNRVFSNLETCQNLQKFPQPASYWTNQFNKHDTSKLDASGYAYFELIETEDSETNSALDCACKQVSILHQHQPEFSIGILVRENKLIPTVRDYLRKHFSITATEDGGNPLTDYPLVRAIISLLQLADHPDCKLSRFHIANSIFCGVFGFYDHTDTDAAYKLSLMLREKICSAGFGGFFIWLEELISKNLNSSDKERLSSLITLGLLFDESNTTIRCEKFVAFIKHEKLSSKFSNNIRVMTIHAAKGLEFDTVVIPSLKSDLAKTKFLPALAYRTSPTEKPRHVIPYVKECFRSLLPLVKKTYDDDQNAQMIESLNVLYVALTRAKYGIYIFTEKNTRGGISYADILEQQLITPGTNSIEIGDASWFRHLAKSDDITDSNLPKLKISQTKLALLPPRYYIETPSAQTEPNEDHKRELFNLSLDKNYLHGRIIHAFFEACYWLDWGLDNGAYNSDDLINSASKSIPRSQINPEHILEFQQILKRVDVKKYFLRENYLKTYTDVEVKTELPFAVLVNNRIISGRIDRAVFCFKGDTLSNIEIFDIKTSASKEMSAELTKRYQDQIGNYCIALSTQYNLPIENVTGRLLYV